MPAVSRHNRLRNVAQQVPRFNMAIRFLIFQNRLCYTKEQEINIGESNSIQTIDDSDDDSKKRPGKVFTCPRLRHKHSKLSLILWIGQAMPVL